MIHPNKDQTDSFQAPINLQVMMHSQRTTNLLKIVSQIYLEKEHKNKRFLRDSSNPLWKTNQLNIMKEFSKKIKLIWERETEISKRESESKLILLRLIMQNHNALYLYKEDAGINK